MRENEFSRAQLWEPSFHNWHHPIASRGYTKAMADAAGVEGADMGMLRVVNDTWEIFMGSWITFDFSNQSHFFHANACNRYSVDPNGDLHPGWSYGPAHGFHDEVAGLFEDVYGRRPTLQEKMDIEHDQGMWNALRAASAAKNPPVVVEPPKPPVTPPLPVGEVQHLQAIKNLAERESASIKTEGGGIPINRERKAFKAVLGKIIAECKKGGALLLLLCLLPLTGCRSAGGMGDSFGDILSILFTGVTAKDGEFTCVVTGPSESMQATVVGVVDPQAGGVAGILSQFREEIGEALPCNVPNDPQTRLIFCNKDFRARCLAAVKFDVVEFTGSKSGALYHPKRLVIKKAQT